MARFHPARCLLEEVLAAIGDQASTGWAQAIDVPESRIHAIVEGGGRITADTESAPFCRFLWSERRASGLRNCKEHDLKLAKQALLEKCAAAIGANPAMAWSKRCRLGVASVRRHPTGGSGRFGCKLSRPFDGE